MMHSGKENCMMPSAAKETAEQRQASRVPVSLFDVMVDSCEGKGKLWKICLGELSNEADKFYNFNAEYLACQEDF